MKKVLKLLIEDLKRIFKNPITFIVIIGLCILPSLYAWINIYACWDPYANTNNLPVVVVNKDIGTTWKGQSIQAGDEIIAKLETNTSVGWFFEDEWEAHKGLSEGKYYALIEIPVNFSSNLVSITSTTPIKPEIIYKANEKANAIATKITHVVVTKLEDEIKSAFIEMVYKIALEEINTVATYLVEHKTDVLAMNDTLKGAEANIEALENYFLGVSDRSDEFTSYLEETKDVLPQIEEDMNVLQNLIQSSTALTNTTTQSLSQLRQTLGDNLEDLLMINDEIQTSLEALRLDSDNGIEVKELQLIQEKYDRANRLIEFQLKIADTLNKWLGGSFFKEWIYDLEALKANLNHLEETLNALLKSINAEASIENINELLDHYIVQVQEINKQMQDVENYFSNQGESVLGDTIAVIKEEAGITDSLAEAARGIGARLGTLADFMIATSYLTSGEAQSLLTPIHTIQAKINTLQEKTGIVTEDKINTLIEWMSKDPETISDFLGAPLEIVQEDVYKSVSFGVGLTPFYSVLAIWIGALLACCLLSVSIDEKRKQEEQIGSRQVHISKLLLFYVISIIQALIIVLGDVYLLGVEPDDLKLLLGFTMVISLSFTTLIFTLVCKLGNIGKAIAVVMMVFQIAGSGGIYPVETNPEIFSILAPLWPFTYAMGGLREAIAGPIKSNVLEYFTKLSTFWGVFVVLLLIRTPIHKWIEWFDETFKENISK